MNKKALQDQAKVSPSSRLQDGINALHQRTCQLTLTQVSVFDGETTINRASQLHFRDKVLVKEKFATRSARITKNDPHN